uniref:Predicted protein n=1 Tax=Physcomitrium patens TaxID=3218 RepID=A9U4S4_PHYPA
MVVDVLALEVSSSFVLCSHRAQVFVRKMRTRLSMSNLDQWVAGHDHIQFADRISSARLKGGNHLKRLREIVTQGTVNRKSSGTGTVYTNWKVITRRLNASEQAGKSCNGFSQSAFPTCHKRHEVVAENLEFGLQSTALSLCNMVENWSHHNE